MFSFVISHLYFEGYLLTGNSNSSFRFSKLARSVKVRFWRKLTYDLNIFGANQKLITQGIISKDDFCYFILMVRGNVLPNPNYAIFLFSEAQEYTFRCLPVHLTINQAQLRQRTYYLVKEQLVHEGTDGIFGIFRKVHKLGSGTVSGPC